VGRKRPKSHKPNATQNAGAATLSALPMELQVGDRFTDHEFEWEVLTHPAVLHGAKRLREDTASGTSRERAGDDVAGPCENRDSTTPEPGMNQLPYLLPWVRVLILIRDILSTTWLRGVASDQAGAPARSRCAGGLHGTAGGTRVGPCPS
jgi:hypothetical protein